MATIDVQRYCVGDRILALENRYDLGILNGDLGTITGADHRAIRIRTDNGRDVSLPLDYVTDHLQHGYARTVHKTQGLTCEVALLLGDDTLYAELGYTGLTAAAPRTTSTPSRSSRATLTARPSTMSSERSPRAGPRSPRSTTSSR